MSIRSIASSLAHSTRHVHWRGLPCSNALNPTAKVRKLYTSELMKKMNFQIPYATVQHELSASSNRVPRLADIGVKKQRYFREFSTSSSVKQSLPNRSDQSVFIAPEGMSRVNAFRALWENSRPAAFFASFPDLEDPQAKAVSTAEKVAALLKKNPYVDYAGGRMLKINFSTYPELNVRSYDMDFGAGAAKKAILEYNKIPSNERFDKNDSYNKFYIPH